MFFPDWRKIFPCNVLSLGRRDSNHRDSNVQPVDPSPIVLEPPAAPIVFGLYSTMLNLYSTVPESEYNGIRNSCAPPCADVGALHSAVPAHESPTEEPESASTQASGSHL